ncbi:hypothetical protein [Zooshikella harenae]|uniref:Uncharacterized protein n=1 Tax=Zooshikella harenae TaxID=2827238 RepID=A0ABS5ZJH8_9GAMM|nr:hypothetical protein [Zooshikella harenae]MBU2713958.1 hypothetical protein [Zooshikella harenae]
MHHLINCTNQAGIFVTDLSLLKTVDEEFMGDLNIALDDEGETEVTFDFPDELWCDVWKQESSEIVDAINNDKFSLILLKAGTYKLEVLTKIPQANMLVSTQWINVSSGKISFLEAGQWIEDFFSDENTAPILELSIPNGKYTLSYYYNSSSEIISISVVNYDHKPEKLTTLPSLSN